MSLTSRTIAISLIGIEIIFGIDSSAELQRKAGIPWKSPNLETLSTTDRHITKNTLLEKALYKYSIHPNHANEIDTTLLEFIGINLGHSFVGFGYQDRTAVWDTKNVEKTYHKMLESQALNEPIRSSDIDSTFLENAND